MPNESKLKAMLLLREGVAVSSLGELLPELQSTLELTSTFIANSSDPSEIAEALKGFKICLVSSDLCAFAKKLESLITAETRLILVQESPISLLLPDSREVTEMLSRHSILVSQCLSREAWIQCLKYSIYPQDKDCIQDFAGTEKLIIHHKLTSQDDIGWIADTINFYLKENKSFSLSRFSLVRQILAGLTFEGLSFAKQSGARRPSIELQVCPSQDDIAVSFRFPILENAFDLFRGSIANGVNGAWFNAWQSSNFFHITRHLGRSELEVFCLISTKQKNETISIRNLSVNFEASNTTPVISNQQAPNFRTFDSILDEIPEDRKKALPKQSGVENESSENSALAKLMHKKSQLVQQLSQRVEQEQAMAQDRHRKIHDLLTEARSEYETTKRELISTKQKLRHFERVAKEKPLSSSGEDLEVDESLNDINNSLRTANSEKITIEGKLVTSDKKITLLEKKYAKAIKDSQELEKELAETKPVIMKLTKELEVAQSALKQNAQNIPVQLNNEEYEKKIKALSSKIYEQQQKETELQLQVKKLSIKMEQSEIGRKSGKNEVDGRHKILEKQVEQAKVKEKELLKKIDDLTILVKKIKNIKAA